jgi:hypothetical protein
MQERSIVSKHYCQRNGAGKSCWKEMTREQAYIREQMKSVDFYMLKTQVQTRIRWFIQILV